MTWVTKVKKNPVNMSKAMLKLDVLFRPYSFDILVKVKESAGIMKRDLFWIGSKTTISKRVNELIGLGLIQYERGSDRGSTNWRLYITDYGISVLYHMTSIYRDIYKTPEIPLELKD